MKKTGILNRDISYLVASLGHKDTLVVADAGLPVPPETACIDLALSRNLPPFLDTLKVILLEMQVESAVVASEMKEVSPQLYREVENLLAGVTITAVPHEDFKERTRTARAVIRSGEFTPYANIILVAGVVF
jgi:D-ribose pyranase